ncbi:MAG: hypothetical protein WD055_04165 [Candidatus Dependentiae bacterium]
MHQLLRLVSFLICVQTIFCVDSLLLTQDGRISKPLQILMRQTGLGVCEQLESSVLLTQKHWLRKPGVEREALIDTAEMHKKRKQLLKCVESLGMIKEITPQKIAYTHMLIMGNYNKDEMRTRLLYAKQLSEVGLGATYISILAGSQLIEDHTQLNGIKVKKTELQMIGDLLHELELDTLWQMPSGFREVLKKEFVGRLYDFNSNVSFISVPPKIDCLGSIQRPTTQDTLRMWLYFSPKPGNCLLVSNQPFVRYQTAVARAVCAQGLCHDYGYRFEGAGPEAKALPVCAYLDTIARQLHNEKIMYERVKRQARL